MWRGYYCCIVGARDEEMVSSSVAGVKEDVGREGGTHGSLVCLVCAPNREAGFSGADNEGGRE